MGISLKTILVVDDTEMNLKMAKKVLESKYNIEFAKSGREALDYLKNKLPDLILLDLIMPEMDGFETYERIKDNRNWKDIPVIFLTAGGDRSCEIKGFRMGAMDFISKPIEPEIMRSRVDRIMEMYSMKADLIKQVEIKTQEAQKDSLTDLYNRGYLENQVNNYFAAGSRKGALFILDVDNFKGVNDTYGHLAGDAVLVRFADKVKNIIRADDIACRIGGDEFILFFPGSMSGALAVEKAQDLIDSYDQVLKDTKTDGVPSGISVGIAMAPTDGIEFTSLYNSADRALYYVKQNGKHGIRLYRNDDDYHIDVDPAQKVNTEVDINHIEKLIKEPDNINGAYEIEYEGFKNIYQFISRCIPRTHQSVQMVLITMYAGIDVNVEMSSINEAMEALGKSITKSLRKGDVATQFSSTQFVVLLMDTDEENAGIVVDRTIERFYGGNYNPILKVKYDIRQL